MMPENMVSMGLGLGAVIIALCMAVLAAFACFKWGRISEANARLRADVEQASHVAGLARLQAAVTATELQAFLDRQVDHMVDDALEEGP